MKPESLAQQKSPKHAASPSHKIIPLILVGLAVLLFSIFFKEHSSRQPTWMKSQALPSKEEKNGFTTYFPGHDVYAWTISPARFLIGGADGCFEYQKAEGTFWQLEHLPYVYAVIEHQGALYIASDEGLYIFEDHREISRPIQSSIRDRRLRMLYEDANDILWAGGFGGVTSENGQHYDASNGLVCDMVNVMLSTTSNSPGDKRGANSDQSQELWFGSYSIRGGGISIVDQEEGEQGRVTTEKNIVHPNVNVILKLDDRHVLTGGGFYDAGGETCLAAGAISGFLLMN